MRVGLSLSVIKERLFAKGKLIKLIWYPFQGWMLTPHYRNCYLHEQTWSELSQDWLPLGTVYTSCILLQYDHAWFVSEKDISRWLSVGSLVLFYDKLSLFVSELSEKRYLKRGSLVYR